MYELIKLINFAIKKSDEGRKLALATIINTVGSSYRKKGTQMVIGDDSTYEGALSGGCVESDALRLSQSVLKNKESVIFEYDGRYKLGCNGKIYVVIEYLERSILLLIAEKVTEYRKKRRTIRLGIQTDSLLTNASVFFSFNGERQCVSGPDQSMTYDITEELEIPPQYQLIIIGGEYDSYVLANMADLAGIKTLLIGKESSLHKHRSAVKVAYMIPDVLSATVKFDMQTAIVIMTHSLSRDLSYLIEMYKVTSAYLGILGPSSRKETILNDLMNYNESLFLTCSDKLQSLRGPIGLMIGAKTPEEISSAILSEIIAVFNHQSEKCDITLGEPKKC